jgi:hypothetical protein
MLLFLMNKWVPLQRFRLSLSAGFLWCISCHLFVISCHFISCHVMSFHFISCNIMSFHFMSFHVMHVMSCHVTSFHVMSLPFMSTYDRWCDTYNVCCKWHHVNKGRLVTQILSKFQFMTMLLVVFVLIVHIFLFANKKT